jgi:hypothetical protein
MAGNRSNGDGEGFCSLATDKMNDVSVQSEKSIRRRSASTNSCSGSIGSVAAVEVEAEDDDQMEGNSTDEICKSNAQESNPDGSSSILHKSDLEAANKSSHVIGESEPLSDISQSESEPSIDEEWMINNTPQDPGHRTHTICSVITNPSDHGSIQSLRESVDRVIMSSVRSRSDGRECMQKNFSPAVAQMLFDQNYYRSADWLRFVPRRYSQDDISSSRESNSSPAGSQGNLTPDRFYRMFDNTRIRVGLHPGQGKTIVRQQENDQMGDNYNGEDVFETPVAENFRLAHPDLLPIDEEEAGVTENAQFFCSDIIEPSSNKIIVSDIPPPTKEIYCDPNSDSCQIALEEDFSPRDEEYTEKEVDEIVPQDSNLKSFQSSLRKGAIVRPTDSHGFIQNHSSNLPEHIREEQMHLASWDSKYETYACRVDQTQDDRAVEIPVFSMARPHMRAFHFAWLTFFLVFLAWFSIAPLLSEIQVSLDLTKEQIWTSSIFSVAGGLVSRCIMGVLCDFYGARLMSAVVLFTCGLPTCFTGLVNTSVGLSILRLVIGIGGSAFVTCQYWTCTMFTREVAGTANALAAGWGNLGGGVTLIVTGSVLFPFFDWIYSNAGAEDPAELAWRTCCIIPGLMCVVFTFIVVRSSDDCPKGNYQKRKRLGLMQTDSAMSHLKAGVLDYNTWVLLIQCESNFVIVLL